MPSLSLMIHTASPDAFLATLGIPSYFAALCANLTHQSFQDFELVYVDTYHEQNRNPFAATRVRTPFLVKHVPVHPAHRYWYDRNHCFIAAAKNTGILYSDGELLVTCDDAEFFPPEFLGAYWHHYRSGRYMHAMHKRLRSIQVADGYPISPLTGDTYVNDHRWRHVANGEHHIHQHGQLLYAGTSFSLHDGVNLNGYNERMDGCKSLDDCDFGNRLAMLGRSFALDPKGYAYILDHPSYGDIPTTIADGQETPLPAIVRRNLTNFIAVENHGMLRCAKELQDPVANRNPLTAAHWDIIREDTIKYRHFDPLDPARTADLEIWKGTPTFNLAEERLALRRSPDWKWS